MNENYKPEEETAETKAEETSTENVEEAVNVTENPVPMLSEDVVLPEDKTEE